MKQTFSEAESPTFTLQHLIKYKLLGDDKSNRVRVWYLHALRLKIEGSHLNCKTANKCLNVRERVDMVDRNKDPFSTPLLSCESSMFAEEANKSFEYACYGRNDDFTYKYIIMKNP